MAQARELRTIGDALHLRGGPLARQRARRSQMTGMGASLPGWAPPSSVDDETQDAALALQNYLDNLPGGTPSMHTYDAAVAAFQIAWNGDPSVQGSQAVLEVDGAYGPNTRGALDFVTGLAQAVNAGPAPAIDPKAGGGGAPPLNLTTPNTQGSPIGVIVLVGALAFAGWAVFFRKKKRGGATTIDVKSNPRRKGSRRSALLAFS